MGIISGLFLTLAGGSYVTGKLFKEHVQSRGLECSDIVHDFDWYKKHALQLNHDRQKELVQLYKSDKSKYEALVGGYTEEKWEKSSGYITQYLGSGKRWGGYIETTCEILAMDEGWLYDKDFRLNEERKHVASDKAMEQIADYIRFAKEKRKLFEARPDILKCPYVGDNNHWWIADTDTGFYAYLENLPWVSDDGVWVFGHKKTNYVAPTIGLPHLSVGYWGSKDVYAAPYFFKKNGRWYVKRDKYVPNSRCYDMELEVVKGAEPPHLMSDGYFWYNGEKTKLRISTGNYEHYTPSIRAASRWAEDCGYFEYNVYEQTAEIELETEPYEDPCGVVRDTKNIDSARLDTGIPVARFRKKRVNPTIEAETRALVAAAWIGWPHEMRALEELCRHHQQCFRWFVNDRERIRNKDLWKSSIYIGDDAMKSIKNTTKYVLRCMGYSSYDAAVDQEIYTRKLNDYIKSHENPSKLDEWSNLIFDLVNGEEHIRANEPGRYEELLKKFKDITGFDFARGVDYFETLELLAIEDGWYIPEANKAWFKNPALPKKPDEPYGCTKLPTRYK